MCTLSGGFTEDGTLTASRIVHNLFLVSVPSQGLIHKANCSNGMKVQNSPQSSAALCSLLSFAPGWH